jgi:hypothetical protein
VKVVDGSDGSNFVAESPEVKITLSNFAIPKAADKVVVFKVKIVNATKTKNVF